MIDLVREFAAAVECVSDSYVRAFGIPSAVNCTAAMLVGVGRVIIEGKYFRPDAKGDEALITAAGTRGQYGIIWDVIDDLVAIPVDRPSTWARRRADGVILGEDYLERATCYCDEMVPMYSTPLDWLRAGGEGVCVLDWEAPLPLSLTILPAIAFDHRALGCRVEKKLQAMLPRLPEFRLLQKQAAIYGS